MKQGNYLKLCVAIITLAGIQLMYCVAIITSQYTANVTM